MMSTCECEGFLIISGIDCKAKKNSKEKPVNKP